MSGEKEPVKENDKEKEIEVVRNVFHSGEPRIQFTQTVRPDRGRLGSGEKDAIRRRSLSRTSIPPVLSEKEHDRRKKEKEEDKKNVDIDEHRMSHKDVAERYETRINMEKPGESLGLTSQQVEQLLQEHGRNVLTPPKKRHPILKFLDYLRSVFNLLLIFAGILEYILLGISFKNNFQNVSFVFSGCEHEVARNWPGQSQKRQKLRDFPHHDVICLLL